MRHIPEVSAFTEYIGAYGELTYRQLNDGTWQGVLRLRSDIHCEAAYTVLAATESKLITKAADLYYEERVKPVVRISIAKGNASKFDKIAHGGCPVNSFAKLYGRQPR